MGLILNRSDKKHDFFVLCNCSHTTSIQTVSRECINCSSSRGTEEEKKITMTQRSILCYFGTKRKGV